MFCPTYCWSSTLLDKSCVLPPPLRIFLITLFSLWEIVFDILVNTSVLREHAGELTLLTSAVYALICILFVRDNWRKTLFLLLVISSLSNIIHGLSLFLEHLLFPFHVVQALNGWSFSLCLALLEAAILIPVWIYIRKYFTPVMQLSDPLLWRFLWLVPAAYHLIWYFSMYVTPDRTHYRTSIRPTTVLFNMLIMTCSFFTYHIIVTQVCTEGERLALLETKQNEKIQQLQYKNLMNTIADAKIARHDLKHHLSAMSRLLQDKQYEKLHSYFAAYEDSLHFQAPLNYCEDTTANLIIGYYALQAQTAGIHFDAAVKIPGELPIEKTDLGALLGNLLRNALEACLEKTADAKEKQIKLLMLRQGEHALLLSVKNTAEGLPLKKGGGTYASTKHSGDGLGLSSVRRIAEKYGGSLRISFEDGLFSACVLLYTKMP